MGDNGTFECFSEDPRKKWGESDVGKRTLYKPHQHVKKKIILKKKKTILWGRF